MILQSVQVAFVTEKWMDHVLGQAREAEGKLDSVEKAHVDSEKKLKDALFHLAEVKKSCKNAEFALADFEKQVEEARVAQKKAETHLALAIIKTKQQYKQLEAKDVEMAKSKQVAYDAGMTKTAQSLTAQLRVIARAFYLEVWGEALNAARVNKVYYPSALCLAPSLTQPSADPSFATALAQPTTTSVATLVAEKEEDQTPPVSAVDVDSEEVVEIGQLKRKKKEKEKEASA